MVLSWSCSHYSTRMYWYATWNISRIVMAITRIRVFHPRDTSDKSVFIWSHITGWSEESRPREMSFYRKMSHSTVIPQQTQPYCLHSLSITEKSCLQHGSCAPIIYRQELSSLDIPWHRYYYEVKTMWFDNKQVLMMSTCYWDQDNDQCKQWTTKDKKWRCQMLSKMYNENIGGVYLAHRILSICPLQRNRWFA